MSKRPRLDWPVAIVATATFVNGALGLLHALFVRVPEPGHIAGVMPFGLHHWSKLLTLLTGFLLLLLSHQLWRRLRAAWWLALVTSLAAALAHLGRQHHAALAAAPAATCLLLLALRPRFTVRSEPRSIVRGLAVVAASLVIAILYGTVGFWLLDRRDFGIEFHWRDALARSLRQYALAGNSDLQPHTRQAHWFLDSLDAMGIGAALVASVSLFRPLAFRLRQLPNERADAARIVAAHGNSSLDHFKLAADKSFYFDETRRGFIAYHAAWGVAVALGDPVGPDDVIDPLLRGFARMCTDNGWRPALHQAGPRWVPVCREAGLGVLKIGEEAIVDLSVFAATTSRSSAFRRVRNRAANGGIQVTYHAPPLTQELLGELERISDEWLSLPGRRERGFTLGRFDRHEIQATPVFVARDREGRALAFANQIPCWPASDATIDLMRHRIDVPNSTMDILLLEILTRLGATHRRFSLGLAPLSGVGDRPGATIEERAVHQMYERLNRFFSYKGLRSYKAKFDPAWHERFLVYQGGPAGLVATGMAVGRITEGPRG
ncbi:MAG TPA: phosphatidylglycerol lysyltransferase domain-containing protein [Candidatus Krumholzibacteria bacterium]